MQTASGLRIAPLSYTIMSAKIWFLVAMARPYASEMDRLGDTLAWAATAELKPLQAAVGSAGLSVLRAIGSGGSLTAAHAVAAAHEQFAGRMAAVVTPLEASQYADRTAPSLNGSSPPEAGMLISWPPQEL